jgi:hypothetical protein
VNALLSRLDEADQYYARTEAADTAVEAIAHLVRQPSWLWAVRHAAVLTLRLFGGANTGRATRNQPLQLDAFLAQARADIQYVLGVCRTGIADGALPEGG